MTEPTTTPGKPYARIADLDFKRIGETLLALPLTTVALRHTSIESSLDYVHPEPGTESEFVKEQRTDFGRVAAPPLCVEAAPDVDVTNRRVRQGVRL